MITFLRINSGNQTLLDHVAEDVFDGPVDPKKREACISSPDRIQLVAVQDGIVVGQLLAVVHRHVDKPAELYVDDLGVTPRAQRRGVATRLVKKAHGIALAQGMSEVWLAVEEHNAGAKAFYAAIGMKGRPATVFDFTTVPGAVD